MVLIAAFGMFPTASYADLGFTLILQSGDGDQFGTANILQWGDAGLQTHVELNAWDPGQYSAHIHPGTCGALDRSKGVRLTNLTGYGSATVINSPITYLLVPDVQPYAIEVHSVGRDGGAPVACGDTVSSVAAAPTDSDPCEAGPLSSATGGAGQPSAAALSTATGGAGNRC